MIKACHYFPPKFLWGTASSSHQVEGDNANNDWYAWESQPGRILEGHRSGKACDWWGGRWREDFDRAADAGQNAHRLSIEWSRVEPNPAKWDEAAIDFYRQMIKGALERGLEPMVTLHHFTNPLWVMEKGGWLSEDIAHWFQRYVIKVVGALSDLASMWVTINEPNVFAVMGYLEGVFPPGEKDPAAAIRVIANMLKAHAAAYHAIHLIRPGAKVGVAHHFRGMRPASERNPLDWAVTRCRSRVFNQTFPRALKEGVLRLMGRGVRVPEAIGTQDFFGLNYYTLERVAFDLRAYRELFGRGFYPPEADLSQTGFMANEPSGMWDALRWAHGFGLPIYITENGVEAAQDEIRPRYIAMHIRQLWRAVNFNWPVRGYFHWTLVDNFEWERGWTQRFGLWNLDRQTQARARRPSAGLYEQICKTNGLSSEMVAQFAPEVFQDMFPG